MKLAKMFLKHALNQTTRDWDTSRDGPRSHTKWHEAKLKKSLRVSFVWFRVERVDGLFSLS
ncbi:MAG: hypothetical protein AUG51_26180 [Acidobacteria bacterium 13_1_20CM_3_53_8]|nr:MAG: hypothetical protein AUG51_26180 [Acidobacteria bacterium 13_1_20CM_3_53_8]